MDDGAHVASSLADPRELDLLLVGAALFRRGPVDG
jgi:hypothetical protein